MVCAPTRPRWRPEPNSSGAPSNMRSVCGRLIHAMRFSSIMAMHVRYSREIENVRNDFVDLKDVTPTPFPIRAPNEPREIAGRYRDGLWCTKNIPPNCYARCWMVPLSASSRWMRLEAWTSAWQEGTVVIVGGNKPLSRERTQNPITNLDALTEESFGYSREELLGQPVEMVGSGRCARPSRRLPGRLLGSRKY
jgi:hypothetical protein